jgi:hypothetical protein
VQILAEVHAREAGDDVIPVSVRLSNSLIDKHITNRISGLSYRSVAPGGFASAQFSLQSPIDANDPLLSPFTRVYIYDGRSAETLWEGRLQMSGKSADDNGQVWALTAAGPAAHTQDETAVLIYIDTQLNRWVKDVLEASNMPATANVAVSTYPTGTTDGVLCQFGPNTSVNSPNSRASAGYYAFIGSDMEIGAFGYGWDSGFTSTNFAVESIIGAGTTYTNITDGPTANIAGGTDVEWVIDDFTGGKDIVGLRLRRSAGGATVLADDFWWAFFYSIRVLGRRMTKDGILVSGAAGMGLSSVYVRASWVVEDLLGRLLPQFDGENAAITAPDTIDIEQFAYPDGVTPNQVLADLMLLEPASYWAAWESNTDGKYRFEWKNWPTVPRYEASVVDGFNSPTPTFEQYNKVRVRWKDTRSRTKTTVRTGAVTELDDAGVIRTGFVDLGDELGSTANANSVGDNFLAEHKAPTSSGTLTLARPIVDNVNNRRVDPLHIRPGELIRVRGVEATWTTNLAETTRDGVTVFRIVSVEVNSDGEATLELDMFTRSEARVLSEVLKKRERKR